MAKKKKAEKPPREYTRRQLSQLKRQRRRQRIIFYGGVFIIAAVVLIVLIGWYIGEYRPLHRTILRVNDEAFNTGYYIDVLKFVGLTQGIGNIEAMSSNVLNDIAQNEFIRQKADQLDITVSDEEAKEVLQNMGAPVNDGSIDFVRAQLLQSRLRSDYFSTQVPESDVQVHAMVMLVESERRALEVINKLGSGDNFTALAGEYALDYYAKNVNQGDYGWHPESIYELRVGSPVAIEYAFSAEPGVLSQPLFDEDKSKQLGYWLINVLEKQYEDEAQIQALLLSSEVEAEDIKARLEAGEDLEALASEYSQYSESKEKGGELGLVAIGNISDAFDEYVFNPEVEIGVWSEPIQDDTYWTKGGYWLVEVLERDEDREISDEDRNILIEQAFNNWISLLWVEAPTSIDYSGLTLEIQQWATDRVLKELQSG